MKAVSRPSRSEPRRVRPDLARDARGAMALLALVMAVFLTALVAYVVGIGESVLYRERMQDGADAAAFAAAVLHARGMNLIALVNMSMAALLAVLVALKLVETVIAIALIAIALSSFLAPGLASAIPPLSQLRSQVRSAHDQLRPPIHSTLQALHAAGRALREVVPAASAARAAQIAAAQPGSPVVLALAVPPRTALPTVDGSFEQLCERAGDYVGDTAQLVLGGFVPEPIADEVSAAVGDLARARADWFCGADGAAPPTTERRQTVRHPVLPSRERCASFTPGASDYDAEQHREACEEAERDEQAAQPQRITGRCERGCTRALYDRRAELARAACAQRRGRDRLQGFLWQERRFRREYTWRGGGWRVTSSASSEEASAEYWLERGDLRPCGRDNAKVAAHWNLATCDADGRPLPLCSNAAPPEGPGHEGATRSVEHLEVARIFGCSEKVRIRYELDAEHRSDRVGEGEGSSSQNKVPQVLEAGVQLGDDTFQIRAIALGAAAPGLAPAMIEIATWDDPPSRPRGWLSKVAPALGRVALAQAEYFYAVEQRAAPEPSSFLWNMRWQARLRRFRVPQAAERGGPGDADALGPLQAICESTLGRSGRKACRALPSILDLVVH
jgi:hypothetical protein